MSQNKTTVIDAQSTNGVTLAGALTANVDAELTQNSGATRPPYAKVGTLWLDVSDPVNYILNIFDGFSDHAIITFNPQTGQTTGGGA